jgi:hypothetical protein
MYMEIWKDIIGYEGLYQVSNKGRVKSVERIVKCGPGGFRKIKERFVYIGKINKKQRYPRVKLWKDNKCKQLLVHRLVAIAFIPNPNNYPVVMHLDNNPNNAYPSNLKWALQSDNIKHWYITK